MSVVTDETQLTLDEAQTLPDRKGWEWIDGELKERQVGAESGWIGGEVFGQLRDHCRANGLGWVFPSEVGYFLDPGRPKTVRKPDVSFVKADRLTPDQIGAGWLRLVPDLVVEVISPNDLWEEGETKLALYRKAGVPLIWVISPVSRTIHVYRGDGSTALLNETDVLAGEAVIPGFATTVASLFPSHRPEVAPTL